MTILIIVTVVLGLACVGLAICYLISRRENKQMDRKREAIEAKHVNLLNEVRRQDARRIEQLQQELHRYEADNEQLVAQNADLREAVKERDDEIKALRMQTVEIEAQPEPEVKPVPVKRTRKKEKTA